MIIPKAPPTKVYLRDRFQLSATRNPTNFANAGKELVTFAKSEWALIAGAQEIEDERYPSQSPGNNPKMMHIWQVSQWDTLYDSMYATSEMSWYEDLERSLETESQDFLVDYRVGYGVTPRPAWLSANDPGHFYLYQDILLGKKTNQLEFLLLLAAFGEEVKAKGCSWIWSASQVTGMQRVVSLLWCAMTPLDRFKDVLTNGAPKAILAKIKASGASYTQNKYMYPIITETY